MHAVESLGAARDGGMHLAYVTNNAARTPETVAGHLTELGVLGRVGGRDHLGPGGGPADFRSDSVRFPGVGDRRRGAAGRAA
ncbi:hypothetical protein GCM10020000_63090 [Streptomyces olivoverticillatus]